MFEGNSMNDEKFYWSSIYGSLYFCQGKYATSDFCTLSGM